MTAASRTLFQLDYGGKLEREIDRVIEAFHEHQLDAGRYPARWLAIKLLEADADILEHVRAMPNGERVIEIARQKLRRN
ncbi:MAG: hypothetical protein HND47_13315 [Chloroflexi bacterium]|nr:hypothetical protein [Chloroflexota bacterium]